MTNSYLLAFLLPLAVIVNGCSLEGDGDATSDDELEIAPLEVGEEDSSLPATENLPHGIPVSGYEEAVYATVKDWVFKIKYKTLGQNNKQQIATALVVIPANFEGIPETGYPILLWNHGTIGLAQRCAVSLNPENSYSAPSYFPAKDFDRKYMTIIPDYDGYGTKSDVHHYATHEVNARSALDAVKSVVTYLAEREGRTIVDKRKLAIAGYSQGGGVTLRALQIQKKYTPDLKFGFALAIAPGSDTLAHLKHMFTTYSEGNRYFGIAAMQFFAVSRFENPDNSIEPFMKSAKQDEIEDSLVANCSSDLLDKYSMYDFSKKTQISAMNNSWGDSPYGAWFKKRVEGNFHSETPIMVVGGAKDEIIAPGDNRALVARLRSNNNKVSFIELPDGNHAGITAATQSLLFLTSSASFFAPEVDLTSIEHDVGAMTPDNYPRPFHYVLP